MASNPLENININLDSSDVPASLMEKISLLAFPIVVLFIIFKGLDTSKGFFEKNKCMKTVYSFYFIKIVFIILFLVYMAFLFLNNRI